MALKKKTKPVDVKTDTPAAPVEAKTEPKAAPVAETETKAAPVQEAAPVEESAVETAKEPAAATEEKVRETAITPAQSTAVAPPASNFAQQAADSGFEGLELGYFSFPTVTLPGEGIFQTSTEVELGKEMEVIIQSSKAKFLIKPKGADNKDPRIAYSYDQMTTTDGTTLDALKAEWSEDPRGCESLEIKKYLDVPAKLIDAMDTTELNGTMVMLSIPPSGLQRFSGYIAELQMLNKGAPNAVITKCKVGNKVDAANSFYPWMFEFVEPVK